jgi:hypothetical protein
MKKYKINLLLIFIIAILISGCNKSINEKENNNKGKFVFEEVVCNEFGVAYYKSKHYSYYYSYTPVYDKDSSVPMTCEQYFEKQKSFNSNINKK